MTKEYLFKILLLGDGAVGKTSIREQFMGKGFAGSYAKTVGADFASHKVTYDGNTITFQIFDLAGQDIYKVARKAFYKGGKAAFLVFDLQDPKTMHNLKTWIRDANEFSGGSIGTYIALGNKADLVETRQVSNENATEFFQRLASELGIIFVFLETSALTGLNVPEAFELMGKRLLKKLNVDVEMPSGIELIKPGSAPVATTTMVTDNGDLDALKGQIGEISEKLDGFNDRLEAMETRFNKLAQIVRGLVEKSQ